MILPISGKSGLMIYGVDEIPIYSFVYSGHQERPTHRTSQSENYPRRTSGNFTEQIIISGVENVPSFYTSAFVVGTSITFKLGWNDLGADDRKIIPITAMLTEFRIDLNYFSSPQPSFLWTATFIGAVNDKEIIIVPITPHLDIPFCPFPLCDRVITTTDSQLNSGFVYHVKRASIINIIERIPYMTSSSNGHYISSTGLKDRIVELEIQGDFDYWINNLTASNTKYNYSFFFSPSNAFNAINMRIIDVTNFVVNIQTGEILSALVRLGAAHG